MRGEAEEWNGSNKHAAPPVVIHSKLAEKDTFLLSWVRVALAHESPLDCAFNMLSQTTIHRRGLN
jgi:hypothetical protein